MSAGKIILYVSWLVTVASLFFFIPRDRVRLALVAFLFKQAMTWPMGLYVADKGWIQYPVRFFENANQASFTFEYFFYPAMCAYFNVYFPAGRTWPVRAAYYGLFSTVLTFAELLILNRTDLIVYVSWNGYSTWVMLFVTFFITRKFCLWFFKPFGGIRP